MSKKGITPAPEDFCKAIECFKKSVEEVTERFNNIVTVVRCKDCKRFVPPHSCTHVDNYIDGDWFCADGEHK